MKTLPAASHPILWLICLTHLPEPWVALLHSLGRRRPRGPPPPPGDVCRGGSSVSAHLSQRRSHPPARYTPPSKEATRLPVSRLRVSPGGPDAFPPTARPQNTNVKRVLTVKPSITLRSSLIEGSHLASLFPHWLPGGGGARQSRVPSPKLLS